MVMQRRRWVWRWGLLLCGLAPVAAPAQEAPRLSLAERQARSVHLFYPAPEADAFYQEVTVEQSHPGSYFMACGFRHGYFGIQEMSRPGQPRRVLFSVWDASRGDNPDAVSEEQRVRVLGHGEDVTIRRFGGEGTGGQSFFFHDWAPGQTYRFLVTAEVAGDRTAYAAYFFLNDRQEWKHIATFDTIAGGDRLEGLYSFIEDFRRDGASAREVRRARFGNGWAKVEGDWRPLVEATFTADRTPSDNIDAGVVEGGFFLATGGDVANQTPLRTTMRRPDQQRETPHVPAMVRPLSLVPLPVRMEPRAGRFVLRPNTPVVGLGPAAPVAGYLAARLRPATGWDLPLEDAFAAGDRPAIVLEMAEREGLGPEGYRLQVDASGVRIVADGAAGLFHGVQTLLQLLPPEIFAAERKEDIDWDAPAVTIEDAPRFAWRGLMLDPGRHFLPVEAVKRFIDVMALQKQNVLHWHLTEDQGWRIDIRKYPRLTEVGSIRAESPRRGDRNQGDGTPYGPYFYTQEQIRDVVAYAQSRFITVVPEIEMPGHSLAALAAYPELGCTGGPYQVRTRWGVEPDIYCAGKEEVFTFVTDVLSEVLELFPSEFIHIGGDEAPKDRWNACPRCQARIEAEGLADAHELQSDFIRRIERFLQERGRRLIGWDEILEGGLAPNASVMSWRGEAGGIAAARAGHDVVMTPTSHCYLDYAQSRNPGEPESIGGYVPLSKAYGYDPVPAVLTPEEANRILGVQGNLWSEYLFEPSDVEYMAFPRACALAEVAWSPPSRKDYADFLARVAPHLRRLDALGVNYRALDAASDEAPIGEWRSGEIGEDYGELSWEVTDRIVGPGTYEIRFQYTHGAHRLDIAWCEVAVDGERVAVDEHPGTTGGRDADNVYRLTLEAPVARGVYAVRARVRSDGGADSNGTVTLRKADDS